MHERGRRRKKSRKERKRSHLDATHLQCVERSVLSREVKIYAIVFHRHGLGATVILQKIAKMDIVNFLGMSGQTFPLVRLTDARHRLVCDVFKGFVCSQVRSLVRLDLKLCFLD